jgi:hypothetical protein
MGNYWEPIDGPMMGSTARNVVVSDMRAEQPTGGAIANESMMSASGRSAGFRPNANQPTDDRGGDMSQYPPSGPRKSTDDFDDDDVAQRNPPSNDPIRSSGGDRQFTYYPEERYWTDYLRIAAPVLGVIILLALAWFWLSHLIGNNGGAATDTTPTSASNPIILASPTSTKISGTPQVVATSAGTPGSGTPTLSGAPIANGSKVVVAGTGSTGVNMRGTASTSGTIVTTLSDGSALTVTGDSVTADGYTWWPVEDSNGNKGFVAADYLQASP